MSRQFERVAGPFNFTEGPAWDGSGVLFTDIPSSRILRYDEATGSCAEHRHGTNRANGLIFDSQGRLYACEGEGQRVARYNPDGSADVIADRFDGKRLTSPNDLAFDSRGRLWFTDPWYGGDASSLKEDQLQLDHRSVYRLDPKPKGAWSIARVTFDTTSPNGILVSPDQHTLYVAESKYGEGQRRELRGYPIRGDGSLGAYLVLHNFYPHRGIDGMCLDADGNIIATAGWRQSGPGPMIYVFAPNGRVLETHPLPEDRPTNCTFGGADLETLYITAGGCLYRTRPGRKGHLVFTG